MSNTQVGTTVIVPDDELAAAIAKALQHQNDALDEALDESFPASDPIAISFTTVQLVL